MVDETAAGRKPVSQSVYAKHRGVSRAAVGKAIRKGRLSKSVVMVDGKPMIGDVVGADREWFANTPRANRAPDAPEASAVPLDRLSVCRLRGCVVLSITDDPSNDDPDVQQHRFAVLDPTSAIVMATAMVTKARQATDDGADHESVQGETR